jgi:hypothetical protein
VNKQRKAAVGMVSIVDSTAPHVPAQAFKIELNDQIAARRINERKRHLNKIVREQFKSEVLGELELRGKGVGECVQLYYDSQKLRIIHENKLRAVGESELFGWFMAWLRVGEETLLGKLREWVEGEEAPREARWAYGQDGIGPVLAAGLSAYIDVGKANSVSALWKYCGQAPGYDRPVKGVKLPYHARLKTLCWKLGDSFVKVSGKEGSVYGRLYAGFKEEEILRNEGGRYREAAARELANKKWKEDTVTRGRLEKGKLSDGHLHSRAKRRAVKIFLQHYWVVGREARGLSVSKPYVEAILGHQDIVEVRRANSSDGDHSIIKIRKRAIKKKVKVT